MVPVGLLVLFALWGLASAAHARAGGVHFDPESPAGKEYALPLQQARNEALGGGGGEGGGGGSGTGAPAPLFGVGVGGSTGGESPGSGGAGKRSAGEPGSGEGAGASQTPNQAPGSGTTAPGVKALVDADHSYAPGQGLLILVGILLLGVALGLGLRPWGRSRGQPA